MLGQASIADFVDLVKNQIEKIETRDQGRGEIDIGRDRQSRIVLGVDRVGCRQN